MEQQKEKQLRGDDESDNDEDRDEGPGQHVDVATVERAGSDQAPRSQSKKRASISSSKLAAKEKEAVGAVAAGGALSAIRVKAQHDKGKDQGGNAAAAAAAAAGTEDISDEVVSGNNELEVTAKKVPKSRKRESSKTFPVDETSNAAGGSATRQGEEVDQETEVELTEQQLEEMRARRLAAKLQQAKMTAYLSALAEQKKAEEDKKKKNEMRAKKRVMLLASRVLQEAAERKLMAAEDKYSNPEDLNSRVLKPEAKQEKKVTPEMAEVQYGYRVE